jgi:protein-S-isoprenylcysteine O-methyltransferase Ste14
LEQTTYIFEAVRLYLALFFSLVAAFYTVRILHMKQQGVPEVVFPGSRFSATWWNHMAFRWFRILIWAICVIRVFEPSLDGYLGMIGFLREDWIILSGAILLTLGFSLAIASHFTLGRAWRSGIDPSAPASLKVTGLYRYSRNPAFLGVAMSQVGFFLALPSLFTAVSLGVGLVTLHRQILSEERHLKKVFAGRYGDYRCQVRRWI